MEGETVKSSIGCPVFKKRKRKETTLVREREDDDGGDQGEIIKPEGKKDNRVENTFSTKRVKENSENNLGVVASTRSAESHVYGGGATAHIQYETEHTKDAQAIRDKNLLLNETGVAGDGIYRGAAGYTNFIKKTSAQLSANKYTGTQGPIRAQTFARSSVRWDYQPDICKDYKQTGFCGFGDSCKFMHDRGDYKAGWQIEKEYQEQEKRKEQLKAKGLDAEEEEDDDNKYVIDSDEDELPFACIICKGDFVKPVVTKCEHYFCESCAMKRYAKNPKCAACNVQTGGIFNVAKKIIERIKKIEAMKSNNAGGGEGEGIGGEGEEEEEEEE